MCACGDDAWYVYMYHIRELMVHDMYVCDARCVYLYIE